MHGCCDRAGSGQGRQVHGEGDFGFIIGVTSCMGLSQDYYKVTP